MDEIEQHRRDCLARYLLNNKPRQYIQKWLDKQKGAFREDMRERLNKVRVAR
jgi:short subunit dehydrogenase-like uncharacterized protein